MTAEWILFDITDTPPDTPPAAWVKPEHHGTLTGYTYGCRCRPCFKAHSDYCYLAKRGQRRCRHCGDTYPKDTGGTKFCQPCLDADVYNRNQPLYQRPRLPCDRCGTTYRHKQTNRYQLCTNCTTHPVFSQLKQALAKHRAPIDLVLAVMDWPYCANEYCGAWLLELVPAERANGGIRMRTNYTIDHDHRCCPNGQPSCGNCIRGVVCRACNHMLITDHPDVMHGLGHYLTRYDNR